jgi:DNA-binding CsgD family transcriptional regulator
MDLIERDSTLTLLKALLRRAAAGGHVALVGAEAGAGKTSVLRALAAGHAEAGGSVWWGACDALDTPHPLSPLLDIAREAAPRFAAHLAGPRPALFDAVLNELRHVDGPLLLVVEDAHWADDATLDLLKFIGRRIERTRVLLAVSFRDDEVGSAHPLRRVLGELPPGARSSVAVPRLSEAAVRALAERAGRRADGVFEATQGNAFFVTEVLRDGNALPAVPHSVRDVVLARYARLGAGAQALLQLVAVVPGRIERWLVDMLLAPPLADLEEALASGLLVASGGHFSYRHELGRVAVESALSAPAALALHERLLAALAGRDDMPPARLVHHAVNAHDGAAVARWAPAAAREAMQRHAHREAFAQRRIALRAGFPADEAEHDLWLQDYANAASQVAEHAEALRALETLAASALARGDRAKAAQLRAAQVNPLIALLRHDDARSAIADAHTLLQGRAVSEAHARVWTQTSFLHMLDRDHGASMRWGRLALALAEALGLDIVAEQALTATGAALLFIDLDAGARLLQDLAERRRRAGNGFGQAMTLQMLGSGYGELMALGRAEACLREAIALCETRDWNHGYASAWLALCLVQRGRWDEAATRANDALTTPDAATMTHLMAWLAMARMRLRRGDPGVADALARARALAEGSGTLQRLAPMACVQAEAAWTHGDTAGVVGAIAPVLPLAQAKGHPWFIGEMVFWLHRVGQTPQQSPQPLAAPYAMHLAGRWAEAAAAWAALDCPYEQARALADGDAAARRQALAIFESLGAAPAASALRRRLRDAGERGLARGARASTRGHPGGLTRTEQKVLALMSQGLRNADIAARIHRSVRTVDHHVAAVLAKLAVENRVAAVQHAQRQGWLPVDPGVEGAN